MTFRQIWCGLYLIICSFLSNSSGQQVAKAGEEILTIPFATNTALSSRRDLLEIREIRSTQGIHYTGQKRPTGWIWQQRTPPPRIIHITSAEMTQFGLHLQLPPLSMHGRCVQHRHRMRHFHDAGEKKALFSKNIRIHRETMAGCKG